MVVAKPPNPSQPTQLLQLKLVLYTRNAFSSVGILWAVSIPRSDYCFITVAFHAILGRVLVEIGLSLQAFKFLGIY